MAALPGSDAREHPRAKTRIRVEYHFGSTTGVGYTTDLSEGGMFIAADKTAQQGARVYLRIHLPGSSAGDPLKIIGAVTRANQPLDSSKTGGKTRQGMGIHFEVAYSRTREALSEFIHGLLLDPESVGDIEQLEGTDGSEPAFGVHLTPTQRAQMLSVQELHSAFAFDASRADSVDGLDGTSSGWPLRIGIAIVLIAVLGYLLAATDLLK